MNSSEKTKQSFWNRRIPKLELGNKKKRLIPLFKMELVAASPLYGL